MRSRIRIAEKLLVPKGPYIDRWHLATQRLTAIREEIQTELRVGHEARSQSVPQLTVLTKVTGSISRLVALLTHKSP